MGFVLSGMNGGALVAPFVAGAVYEHAGYYVVWSVCLGVIAFDLVLRLAMIEKSVARQWLVPQHRTADGSGQVTTTESNERRRLLPDEESIPGEADHQISRVQSSYRTATQGAEDSFHEGSIKVDQIRTMPWFKRKAPAMATLLGSRRILAAVYGCFTHTLLISSFDAVLALFVKRTFLWSSTGAGLIFLAITIPSILGAFIGMLADRYGTKVVALFGFAFTIPSLALLGVVTDGSTAHQAALVILLVACGKTFHPVIRTFRTPHEIITDRCRYWTQFYPRSSSRRYVRRGRSPRQMQSSGNVRCKRSICPSIFAFRCRFRSGDCCGTRLGWSIL